MSNESSLDWDHQSNVLKFNQTKTLVAASITKIRLNLKEKIIICDKDYVYILGT